MCKCENVQMVAFACWELLCRAFALTGRVFKIGIKNETKKC